MALTSWHVVLDSASNTHAHSVWFWTPSSSDPLTSAFWIAGTMDVQLQNVFVEILALSPLSSPLAGQMAWGLRALAALAESPGLAPSTYMEFYTICNLSSRGLDALFWPPWASGMHIHMCRENTHIHIKQILKKHPSPKVMVRSGGPWWWLGHEWGLVPS